MKVDPEADPVVYGAEYGGMILNYLQLIVNNRREMKYLEDFDKTTLEKESITPEELESFQDTFMILDYDCNGTLAMDEIKVCLIMLGEKMDEEEIELLFKEYDEDGSGELSFQEFCVMMKNWRERFGTGAAKVYNEAMQRGAIGKGRRALDRWLNKDDLDRQAIAKIKEKKAKAEADKQAAMEKHMGAEKPESNAPSRKPSERRSRQKTASHPSTKTNTFCLSVRKCTILELFSLSVHHSALAPSY